MSCCGENGREGFLIFQGELCSGLMCVVIGLIRLDNGAGGKSCFMGR